MILLSAGLALALVWWLLMSLDRYGRPFREAGSRVQGHMLEVLLYGAYPKVMMRALGAVTRACGSLSVSLLKPSLWFTLPLLAAVIVVASAYGHKPARTGEPILVCLEPKGSHGPDWKLRPSPQFKIDIDNFRHATKPQQLWRIRPLVEGQLTLVFTAEDKTTVKSLQVGDRAVLLNESRFPLGWSWLLAPLEAPLPNGLRSLSVDYPERTLSWKGYSAPWWLLLLLAFLGWSWLLALLAPGNRTPGQQPAKP